MVHYTTEQHIQGQQLDNNYYTYDRRVFRAYEVDGSVTKYEGWELLGIVKGDDDSARGIVAQNMTTASD